MRTWTLGTTTIALVADEAFELVLALDEATADVVRPGADWLVPTWVTDSCALRVGSAAVAISSSGLRILVDPWLAFDPPGRRSPETAERARRLVGSLNAVGFAPSEVDVVINTHVDGVGLNTVNEGDGDLPTFERARYLFSEPEAEIIRCGRAAGCESLRVLLDDNRVDVVEDGHRVTDEVSISLTGGHSPGHLAVHIDSATDHAVVAGHLFLHPAQVLAPGPRPDLDQDPAAAATARRAMLERCAREGALLIGPLFAPPGGGRVVGEADHWRLQPA